MWNEMVALQAQTPRDVPADNARLRHGRALRRQAGPGRDSTFDIVAPFLLAEIVGGAAIGYDNSLT